MYANAGVGDVDFEKEYWPTMNAERFQEHPTPHEKVLENFMEITGNQTKDAKKYLMRENVRYAGDGDNQILDIYYKGTENDSPIFAYIHGGYWQFLDKSTSGSFVEPLIEQGGYRVVVADYNLCPSVTLNQLTEQIRNFFDWLYKYAAETNASKITICGHSAGAHLITYLLKSEFFKLPLAAKTSRLFLIGGVYDLRELWKIESVNPKNLFDISTEQQAAELSPLLWNYNKELIKFCNDNSVEIHILVGNHESSTFQGQSREYAKKLETSGFCVKFKEFVGYDHMNIIEEMTNKDSAINNYILQNL